MEQTEIGTESEHLEIARQDHGRGREYISGQKGCEIPVQGLSNRIHFPSALSRLALSPQFPFCRSRRLISTGSRARNRVDENAVVSNSLSESLQQSKTGLDRGPFLIRALAEKLKEWNHNTSRIEEKCLTNEVFPSRAWFNTPRILDPILPQLKLETELFHSRTLFAPVHRSGAFTASKSVCFDLELIQRQLKPTSSFQFDTQVEQYFFTFIDNNRDPGYVQRSYSIMDGIVLRQAGPVDFDIRKIQCTNGLRFHEVKPDSDASQIQSEAHYCSKILQGYTNEMISISTEAISRLASTFLKHEGACFNRIEMPLLRVSQLADASFGLNLVTPQNYCHLLSVQELKEYCDAFWTRTWYKGPRTMMSRQKGKLVQFFSTVNQADCPILCAMRELQLEHNTLEMMTKFREQERAVGTIEAARLYNHLEQKEDTRFDTRFLNDYFQPISIDCYPEQSREVLLHRDKEELEDSAYTHGGFSVRTESVYSSLPRDTSLLNSIKPMETSGANDFLSFGRLGDLNNFFSAENQEQSESSEHLVPSRGRATGYQLNRTARRQQRIPELEMNEIQYQRLNSSGSRSDGFMPLARGIRHDTPSTNRDKTLDLT